ncbi:hypothetical protein, partial [Moraxella catarrhalis]
LMQTRATNSHPDSIREISVNSMCTVRESDSSEGISVLFANLNTQGLERLDGIGHQTFSTSFIDGWFERFSYHALDAFLPQRDCSSQASGPTADNHYLSTNLLLRRNPNHNSTKS